MYNSLIGLSVNHKDGLSCISRAYSDSVIRAGGMPVLIPLTNDERVLEGILSQIDGLILSGGGDIHASFFSEELHPSVESCDLERDHYDLFLARRAMEKQMPVLGICRGHQVLNVAVGGSLIQDIPSQIPESNLQHSQSEARNIATHAISIEPESNIHHILAINELNVNSFHHQAIQKPADGFAVVAQSSDGIIEAIESTTGKAVIGVQWHPETMTAENDSMLALFKNLVTEADYYRLAKMIHQNIYTIDSHCDTPLYFSYGIDIGKTNKTIHLNPKDFGISSAEKTIPYNIKVDVPKMQDGMLDATFMVAYLHQGARDAATSQKTVEKTESILKEIIRQAGQHNDIVEIARSVSDLKRLKAEGKKAIFIGIENAYGLGKDIRNVEKFAKMGVSYITLSHNGDNDVCDAAVRSKSEHKGLSEYGKQVVREMNRLGILVDISHTSEKTSFDVLEISQYPIIASHSSVKALCNHPRNISDKLMRAIAEKGGVIQVCLYSGFLKKSGAASVKDVVDHIDYIVKTVGIDYVGIGSDFDGGDELTDCKSVRDFPRLTIELLRRGYSVEDIGKIWGGNLIRVMEKNKR